MSTGVSVGGYVRSAALPPTLRVTERRPEVGYFWVRYWPADWPTADGDWVHLATGHLGPPPPEPGRGTRELPLPLDDVLYLPPVSDQDVELRDRLARDAVDAGGVVVVHRRVGETPEPGGTVDIYDPLDALLEGDDEWIERVPAHGRVVWPLLPALTAAPEMWQSCCRRLAQHGVAGVQALAVQLLPTQRRRLAERFSHLRPEAFEALFHGAPATEREFSGVAAGFGLPPLFERPLPAGRSRRIRNQRIAGVLSMVGELWLRLGRSDSVGLEFYRSARFVDECRFDVEALVREDNLAVLTAVGARCRALIEELAREGEVRLLAELEREYAGGDG